jgi:Putative lumazine-binding
MQSRGTDEEAIRSVARAYLESWLDGDGERMRDAIHPNLAKRGLDYATDRKPSGVHHLTAEYMERSAANGPRPQFARTCEITVLDIADSIASAKVVSEPFVDYLHLAKLDGQWWIVNVLYEDRGFANPIEQGGR